MCALLWYTMQDVVRMMWNSQWSSRLPPSNGNSVTTWRHHV